MVLEVIEGAWCIRPGGSLTQCAQDLEGFGGDISHCLKIIQMIHFVGLGCAPNDAYAFKYIPNKI